MTNDDLAPAELEAAGALGGSPDPGYQWPTDPLVAENLRKWQDLTFGVIIHWGIYTAIGKGGSWSLHRGDLGWFTDKATGFPGDPDDDSGYQDWYYDQARTFTGRDFNASQWARACADAGMTYCIFTTKHHDGFCMYDSAYTNLKSTSESAGLHRDVFREVVDAYRAVGMETGVYFSKADWSHPCYWDRSRPIHDRFHNYDIAAQPHRWQRFVEFTQDQVAELLENYGPMNVLWLDAGWVRDPEEPIDIDAIAARARRIQPGILVVDRAVHGPHENYRTPEQEIPDEVLDHPWESCMTLTKEWCSLSPDDPAKPTSQIIANLIRIVARGGNYLLGIGPDATGRMPDSVRTGLAEIGEWMAVCSEGIMASHPIRSGMRATGEHLDWYLTTKDSRLFAWGVADAEEVGADRLVVDGCHRSARVLGGPTLSTRVEDGRTVIDVPPAPTRHAVGLELLTD